MTHGPAVLVVDAVAADRELISVLLERHIPGATVHLVGDVLPFAEAIYTTAPDAIIVSDALSWAPARDVVALIRRRHPTAAAVVVSGGQSPVGAIPCDAWVQKTSEGFLRLPPVVGQLI